MSSYYVIELDDSGIAQNVSGPYEEYQAYDLAESKECMVTVAESQATFKTN